ncbi:septum formation inhibitor Maf [filamentous cyanobacterium LEGE 11480]|uniref:Nucleoside triphosphate pyrophosphatase n=1 Tax=Romeriopsis navalis LEGE 11480 TaxID=2777977 RepID=A0A928VLL9_9CYAN|nr:nucleoside triphosphate pyrophosphatase [Romeriopsis navalis]MBE9030816.1 septum formation inhibitor Maf [Romeriopsis navalis LEGE 11480]
MLPRFILASQSPARRRLLQQAGIEPECMPSQFDEDSIQSPNPSHLVESLAIGKATVIAQKLAKSSPQSAVVLGCDSVLAINGEIHGKPDSPSHAIERWQYMRGRVGELYTGHALIQLLPTGSSRQLVRCAMTQVHFAQPTDRQIRAYVASGEPLHCAGCFALEGKGSLFIERLQGCHTNVIGLSMPLLRQMLGEMDCDVTAFWR